MNSQRLIVRVNQQKAELWKDSELIKTYRISTAANGLSCVEGSFCTPIGKLRVASKIGDGFPVGTVFRARVPTGEVWSDEPSNPLANSTEDLVLTRILWLEGTNQEKLLGSAVSHGCIRFSNQDILEVFEVLTEGSEVEISA